MNIYETAMQFLDPYDRPARLYPGLLVFAPLMVLLASLYGSEKIFTSSILAILAMSGGAFAISRFVRNAGKRIQDNLFNKWGGPPTTQLLRHRNYLIDVHTKARIHRILSKAIDKQLPTSEEELADPKAADEIYRAAIYWLISHTRDTKKFPLIFKENISFGFQRNAYGIRWFGIFVSVACVGWILIYKKIILFTSPYVFLGQFVNLKPIEIVSLILSLSVFFSWALFISESSLKRTGFAYAERLIESCEHL